MLEYINVNIDGAVIHATKGTSVLDTAIEYGICIPHLCHVPYLSDIGACRLCIVEHVVNGRSNITTSCTLKVEEGMVIMTSTDKVRALRRNLAELLVDAGVRYVLVPQSAAGTIPDPTDEKKTMTRSITFIDRVVLSGNPAADWTKFIAVTQAPIPGTSAHVQYQVPCKDALTINDAVLFFKEHDKEIREQAVKAAQAEMRQQAMDQATMDHLRGDPKMLQGLAEGLRVMTPRRRR